MNRSIFGTFIFLLFAHLGCNSSNEKLLGTYDALYSETFWKLTLKENNAFIYNTKGHAGDFTVNGQYELSGDTVILISDELDSDKFLIDSAGCLIDIETRFDYCKSWPEEWGSRKKNINYPQIKTSNEKRKQDVEWILQQAFQNEEILDYFPDTTKSLVIQEYYEINKEADLDLQLAGKPIIFLSKQEIQARGLEEYIIIDEINVGLKNATVDLQVMPEFNIGILDYFQKEEGKWVHRND